MSDSPKSLSAGVFKRGVDTSDEVVELCKNIIDSGGQILSVIPNMDRKGRAYLVNVAGEPAYYVIGYFEK